MGVGGGGGWEQRERERERERFLQVLCTNAFQKLFHVEWCAFFAFTVLCVGLCSLVFISRAYDEYVITEIDE